MVPLILGNPRVELGKAHDKITKAIVSGSPCYGPGIIEKKMETTVVYWGSIGITEKIMETTI